MNSFHDEFVSGPALPPLFTGPGVLEYVLHTEEHKCKKDALLGRIKHSADKSWKLIRPRPTKTQYVGPYYICKGEASLFIFIFAIAPMCCYSFIAVDSSC